MSRHAEAVGVVKEKISPHKNRTVFLRRKGGAERAAAIARLVPGPRGDAVYLNASRKRQASS